VGFRIHEVNRNIQFSRKLYQAVDGIPARHVEVIVDDDQSAARIRGLLKIHKIAVDGIETYRLNRSGSSSTFILS
jgi:hypothetical protein